MIRYDEFIVTLPYWYLISKQFCCMHLQYRLSESSKLAEKPASSMSKATKSCSPFPNLKKMKKKKNCENENIIFSKHESYDWRSLDFYLPVAKTIDMSMSFDWIICYTSTTANNSIISIFIQFLN